MGSSTDKLEKGKHLIMKIAATLLPLALATKLEVEENANADSMLVRFKVASAEDCSHACHLATKCRVFTFSHNTNNCYLKKKYGWSSRSCGHCTSGVAFENGPMALFENTNFPRADIKDCRKVDCHANDVGECMQQCGAQEGCEVFTYDHRNQRCWLKKKYGWYSKYQSGHTSGMMDSEFFSTTDFNGGDL